MREPVVGHPAGCHRAVWLYRRFQCLGDVMTMMMTSGWVVLLPYHHHCYYVAYAVLPLAPPSGQQTHRQTDRQTLNIGNNTVRDSCMLQFLDINQPTNRLRNQYSDRRQVSASVKARHRLLAMKDTMPTDIGPSTIGEGVRVPLDYWTGRRQCKCPPLLANHPNIISRPNLL